MACINIAVVVITQHNFPGKPALAANFEMLGASLSTAVAPLITQFLVDQYGWRWAMRYHGIIGVNLAVVSWIMRTPQKPESATDSKLSFCQKMSSTFKGLLQLFTSVLFVLAALSECLYLIALMMILVHNISRIITIGFTAQIGSQIAATMAGTATMTR